MNQKNSQSGASLILAFFVLFLVTGMSVALLVRDDGIAESNYISDGSGHGLAGYSSGDIEKVQSLRGFEIVSFLQG